MIEYENEYKGKTGIQEKKEPAWELTNVKKQRPLEKKNDAKDGNQHEGKKKGRQYKKSNAKKNGKNSACCQTREKNMHDGSPLILPIAYLLIIAFGKCIG